MKSIPNYPVIDEHRRHYVRTPIKVDAKAAAHYKDLKMNGKPYINPGDYIAVDVAQSGFIYLSTPSVFKTYEACEKACDIHNRFHGFGKRQANQIIATSMDNSITSNP